MRKDIMIRRAARFLLLAFAALPLGACALADVASGPAPSLYVLTAPEAAAAGSCAGTQLIVEEFSAPAAIDTARIVYKPSPNEIAYYAGARWADRAPRMIASLLVETLADSGAFAAVVGPETSVRSDFALLGDIRAFEAYRDPSAGLGAGATKVKVSLFVRLVRMRDRAIVSSEVFTAEAPAGSGMDAIVAAYDAALGKVLGDIGQWAAARAVAAPQEAGS